MSIEVLIFLALASGFAGFVDAMAGGGGLIQLPALLIGLPNKELPLILGTNKVPSIFGTAAAKAAPVIDPINAGPIIDTVNGISGLMFLK